MSTTNEILTEKTRKYVPDERLSLDQTGRRPAAVITALEKFSTDMLAAHKEGLHLTFKPRVIAVELVANPTNLTTAVTDWDARYSTVLEIEWPFITKSTGVVPKVLADIWTVDVEDDEAEFLRVPGAGISATSKALLRFAAKWTAVKLPPVYVNPLVLLASSIYATGLSGVYVDTVQPEFGGLPLIETSERSTRYKELGDTLMHYYRLAVGLEKVAEASA